MKVIDYQFPKVTDAHRAFPTFDVPAVLLKEAEERGFYNGNTPANKLFNTWFYKGIPFEEFPKFKEGVDKERGREIMLYVQALMGSFAPKHEAKEAVCALIFDELLDL